MTEIVEGSSGIDGTWSLTILVTDLNIRKTITVRGDLHIGGLMLQLVAEVDTDRDWSDHALWWPEKRRWLQHTRSTLDQNGITAEAQLEFTPMHKEVKILLPNKRVVKAEINFSKNAFDAAKTLCRDLGIRHSEETFLRRYIPPEDICRRTSDPEIPQGPLKKLSIKAITLYEANP